MSELPGLDRTEQIDKSRIAHAKEEGDVGALVQIASELIVERRKSAEMVATISRMYATENGAVAGNDAGIAAMERVAHEALSLLREVLGTAHRKET